jgi:hypothetical protein
MKRLHSDTATQHRIAAVFAIAFASSVVVALAGVFALDMRAARFAPAVTFDYLPDSTWPVKWLAGALPAGAQQQAAAQQWLDLVLLFGALAAGIACLNALIGIVAHANERRYETAVRGLVGAAPRQLRRSALAGALRNALSGVVAGAPVGIVAAITLRRAWPGAVMANSIAYFIIGAFVLAIALCALAAHMTGRRLKKTGWLGDALAPEARSMPGYGAEDLRSLLTAAQLACAVALTITGGLVWSYAAGETARAATAVPDRYVASVALDEHSTPQQRRAALVKISHTVGNESGVYAESIASPGALLGIGKIDNVLSECGRCMRSGLIAPIFPVRTQQHVVGAGFFEVAGIAIMRGHEFGVDADDDKDGVVISETFARLAFDDPNPIGRRIALGGYNGEWYRVIGVVADVQSTGLHKLEPDPLSYNKPGVYGVAAIYLSARTHPPAQFDVIAHSDKPVTLAGFSFIPLGDVFDSAVGTQAWFAQVLLLLGMLLCAAALTGVFTTTMLSVRSRRMEIAVRRSLGARRRDVWLLVYGAVVSVTLRGVATGVVLSIGVARLLEPAVPGLPVFVWPVTAIVCAAFALAALLAAVQPARSALLSSPAHAEP